MPRERGFASVSWLISVETGSASQTSVQHSCPQPHLLSQTARGQMSCPLPWKDVSAGQGGQMLTEQGRQSRVLPHVASLEPEEP